MFLIHFTRHKTHLHLDKNDMTICINPILPSSLMYTYVLSAFIAHHTSMESVEHFAVSEINLSPCQMCNNWIRAHSPRGPKLYRRRRRRRRRLRREYMCRVTRVKLYFSLLRSKCLHSVFFFRCNRCIGIHSSSTLFTIVTARVNLRKGFRSHSLFVLFVDSWNRLIRLENNMRAPSRM